MDESKKREDQAWLGEQLKEFIKILPRYQAYARVLQSVLEKAVKKYAPLAIVQTRPKSISSFGEKAMRKKQVGRYANPIERMTDLCGARVIVPTRVEVAIISDFIKNNFEIDWENSVDVSQRLKPTEFGYRGVHYIVKFKRGIFPGKDIQADIPEEVYGLKAEIQVKTILEHAWSVFTHDRAYKGSFKIPQKWEREIATLAALLEDADSDFARVEEGLKRYAASYGAYMTEENMRLEIENLSIILGFDANNTALAGRISKLAITLGDWQTAVDVLSRYADSGHPPILRDLGIATCKLCKLKANSEEYKAGQRHLEAAIAADPADTDAIASLAGTYKGIDEEKVRSLYYQAFEVDPSDPYPLGNYIECEIGRIKDISIVPTLHAFINSAIARCRDQAEVGMNLPWAYFDIGKFNLLLGKPDESLAAYARAVQLSTAPFMIEISLESLDRLASVRDKLPGFEWAKRLLLIGLAVKFPVDKAGTGARKKLKELASDGRSALAAPIVILSGGCDAEIETKIQAYRDVMLEGFWDFCGTIISGGTTAGVAGLAGEIGINYAGDIKTVGYLPRHLPTGVKKDTRYNKLYYTDGNDFVSWETLQYWTDIIAAGIPLSGVKVLGINGGTISAVEYRVALALEVPVAILENSGREADRLSQDKEWSSSKALIYLPADRMTIAAFMGSSESPFTPEAGETIARAIHKNYLAGKTRVSRVEDPSSVPWEQLPEYLKESNRRQADDIYPKLRRIGCKVADADGRKAVKMTFTEAEIELMAEMEHGRWNAERLLGGWKRGSRDIDNKTSPYIVPWPELDDDIKKWDRETVRKIPEFLAKAGLEVRRQNNKH